MTTAKEIAEALLKAHGLPKRFYDWATLNHSPETFEDDATDLMLTMMFAMYDAGMTDAANAVHDDWDPSGFIRDQIIELRQMKLGLPRDQAIPKRSPQWGEPPPKDRSQIG